MSDRWDIKVLVWPYQTGEGQAADRLAVGGEERTLAVFACDTRDALKKAEIFAGGVKTNPRVWMVPIVSIVKVRP